jgi:periplasmic divalent cation tolerance protein
MEGDEYIVVLVVASSQEEAEKIGKILVEEKLAASANIIPSLRSFFFWKKEFYDIPEALLILNTKKSLFEKITKRTKELHSYEIPEIIALSILFGSSDFLHWIKENTKD